MANRDLQQQMYELTDRSMAQRVTLAVLIGAWVALAWWLLLDAGVVHAGAWFGWAWTTGDIVRRASLAVAFSIYFLRLLFTEFVFLRRGVSWTEVFSVAPWVLFIFVFLSIAGGTNTAQFGVAGAIGMVLFVVGSWINSYAEYQRHIWKRLAEHRGQLYTLGLFRYTRHPNYLGDLISFSGICLISGRWPAAAIPAIMLCGFVFVNVPVLDAHLQSRYGVAFDEYARKTKKLVPFIY